jgi:hypothetical protein
VWRGIHLFEPPKGAWQGALANIPSLIGFSVILHLANVREQPMKMRIHPMLVYLCALVLAEFMSLQNSAGQNEQLQEEIKSKCAKYREMAKYVQGKTVSRTVSFSKEDGERKFAYHNHYKQNGNCVLMIEKHEDGNSISEKLYAVNPKYGFILARIPGKQEWALDELFLDDAKKARYGKRELRDHVVNALSLAYPSEILKGTLQVTQVQKKTEDGNEYVVMDYKEGPNKNRSDETNGHLTFFRNNALALAKVESVSKDKGEVADSKIDLEYAGKLRDFPRLSQRTVRSSTVLPDGSVRTYSSSMELDLQYDENVPDSEFTLSAFGLPNPKGAELAQPARYTWLWWGLIGIGVLSVAYFVNRQRQARPAPKPAA